MPPEIITKLYRETTIERGGGVTAFNYGLHTLYLTEDNSFSTVVIKTPTNYAMTSFDTLEEAAEFLFVEAARVRVL